MIVWPGFLSVILLINIIFTIIIIFIERRNVTSTWAWVLVLTFVPVLGFILYLFFGRKLTKKNMFKIDKEHYNYLEKNIKKQQQLLEKRSTEYPEFIQEYRELIHMNLNHHSPLTLHNDIEIITDGRWKFETLLSDIDQAKEHIHMLYYIVRNDTIGNELLVRLAKKARMGVEVRLLYDFLGSRNLPRKLLADIRKAGGKVASFSTSRYPILNFEVNNRNHRKLVIIDRKIGYIGGFNVGNEYLGLNKSFGYWRDTHLKIVGEAVAHLEQRFLLDWRHATKAEISLDVTPKPLHQFGKMGIQIVSSGPDSDVEQIKLGYIKMILSAKKYIYIQTPYFIPDESLLDALKIAALSGVDIRIMIPNKPDHPFIYWATYSNVGELLNIGAKVYIYENGFMHAKTIVVDDKIASVGTANIDVRSFRLNFEVNAFLYHSDSLSRLRIIFEKDIIQSTELTLELYSQRSLYIRFKESISRLLSPIL
ncbi:cardiolipin synthase [Desulfuribacillus alkaliarsenatis]|uniref:Cardiolipin synthase n=1 Tax=Desulfuribacillus alkaliarsenatis TaxID=766136 RepID=A0A1E5G199_9FIRM|nr:cardiolipin synthase [Desulfuribacillus alkaliarsenatis]OEF96600.1 cardiolipin synthase [Desulfuribacillus alkaliarsenatis]